MNATISKTYRLQKPFASAILVVLFANLIIGGILLPYKTVQAIPVFDATNLIAKAKQTIQDYAKWTWEGIQWAYSKAQETISSGVALWEKQSAIVKAVLKVAWDRLRRMLLNMLVNDIIRWVQGGGKPRFVTDWQAFLKNAGDKAAGQFIEQDLKAGFLCGPFAAKLQIALAKPPTFDESVTCTLSKITDNIDKFFDNFSNGGWKGWLTVSEMQNNIYGANLLALERKYDLMAAAKEAAKEEAGSASGYLGDKVCLSREKRGSTGDLMKQNYGGSSGGWTPEEAEVDNWKCASWQTRTPGRVVGDAVQQATGIDIPWLINAKEFSEYAGAIVDAVINRTIKEGILAFTAPSSAGASGPGISSSASVAANTTAIVDASKGNAVMETIIQQEKLLKENLATVLKEHQTNLDLLNQAQTAQENAVKLLQQTVAAGCSLPAGSTLGGETISIQGNCATSCPCTDTTTKNTPFTIAGLGSGTLKEVTTKQYEAFSGEGLFIGTGCTSVTYSAANSSIINSSLASAGSVSQLQNDITQIQLQITQASTTITDSLNYQKAATAYSETYEALLNTTGTMEQASTTEAAMWAAKKIASNSIQALTGNKTTDFSEQLDAIMQLSSALAQKVSDAQTKRGFTSDCSFVETGTYQKSLCDAQTKATEIKNNYDSCLSSQNNSYNNE